MLAPTNASYKSYQVYATNQKVWKKQPSVYLRNLKWKLINVVDKVTTMHQTCRAYTRVFRQGLKEKNYLAEYVPCAAHSLNLAGCFAAEKACPEATIYFTSVQGLYAFFSASTYRWNILKRHIEKGNEGNSTKDQRKLMIKPLSDTRWSATADALRALKISQHELKDGLEELNKDDTQTPATQITAAGFLKTLGYLQNTLLTVIWDEILERVDKTRKTLQNQDLDLFGATKEFETLSSFWVKREIYFMISSPKH